MHQPPADVDVEEDAAKLLSLAVKLDDASRILVQYFLAMAAEQASEKSKLWIQSAVAAEADVTLEVRIVNFIDRGLDHSSDVAKLSSERLKDKIEKLEMFASLAAFYAEELKAKRDLLADGATEPESDDE